MKKEFPVTKRPNRAPTHPGAILKEEVLPSLGLSVSETARQLGVSRQTLHRILSETHPITPQFAVRLGKFCGNGPGLWLRMQQNYDLWHTEKQMDQVLKKIPMHKTLSFRHL
jgi:addiction module HigA family antidote